MDIGTPGRPVKLSQRLLALKASTAPARVILGIDATASREATWDMAAALTASMIEEAAKIGSLDVQLVYYRGRGEFHTTPWAADALELIRTMGAVRCAAGPTNIAGVLNHIRREHAREKVGAAIFVGDAVEEMPQQLYDAAAGLGAPVFVFQEGAGLTAYPGQHGDFQSVESVLRELARMTGGAYGKFDAGAAKQLGEMLRAVAAFAVGGIRALANQRTDSARFLLTQLGRRT
jgi:hypothetical protein